MIFMVWFPLQLFCILDDDDDDNDDDDDDDIDFIRCHCQQVILKGAAQ